MKQNTYLRKILAYCVGLFIIALGVSISKASCLGVSPVNSIPAVSSNITNIDMGICTTVFFCFLILIQVCIMRKEFKIFNLLQIIPSFLFGFFVSGSSLLCDLFLPEVANYFVSIVYLMISIVLVAIGILLYLNAEILSLPAEGVVQAISYKLHIKLSTAKITVDWSMIIIAAILSILGLHELDGIREGTIIAAFGVGMCLKFLEGFMEKFIRGVIYGREEVSASF